MKLKFFLTKRQTYSHPVFHITLSCAIQKKPSGGGSVSPTQNSCQLNGCVSYVADRAHQNLIINSPTSTSSSDHAAYSCRTHYST